MGGVTPPAPLMRIFPSPNSTQVSNVSKGGGVFKFSGSRGFQVVMWCGSSLHCVDKCLPTTKYDQSNQFHPSSQVSICLAQFTINSPANPRHPRNPRAKRQISLPSVSSIVNSQFSIYYSTAFYLDKIPLAKGLCQLVKELPPAFADDL